MAEGGESSNTQKWEKFIEPIKAPVRRSDRLKKKYGEDDSSPPKVIQAHADKKGPSGRSLQSIGHTDCLSNTISVGIAYDCRRATVDQSGRGSRGSVDSMTDALSQIKIKSEPVGEDRSISGVSFSLCQSTFDLITRYVSFDGVQFLDLSVTIERLTKEKDRELPDKLEEIRTDLFESNKTLGMKTIGQTVESEAGARVLIDCVVMKLSRWLDIKTKTEFSLYFENLPGGKLDYIFTDKDGTPLGCLEAKLPTRFYDKAFSQTVMELLLVQQEALREGVDIQHTPVFGILSDGKRYVLMMLDGHYLRLEKTKKTGKLRVRSVDKKDDFNDLINAIIQMILRCQKSKKNRR